MKFLNRSDAGRHLAASLAKYVGEPNVIVLALPRGGVPVAHEVARALGLPLDVFLVRKIGVPFHPELAMGAIAEGGVQVLNRRIIDEAHISPSVVEQVVARERMELERRSRSYRQGRALPLLRDRTVILVDDGLATGSTMEAAVRALRELTDRRIIAAAPVGAEETCWRLRGIADAVVCSFIPETFSAVGLWYEHFDQTSDEEVRQLLRQAAEPRQSRGIPVNGRESEPAVHRDAVGVARGQAWRLTGEPGQYQPLIDGVRDARVVLLGEATHGTHEFYRERAFITRRLITECGFTAVAVEADWPDAYRVNRYVRGDSHDADAVDALKDFGRFPTWMWRNADVLDFVGWLRTYNDARPPNRRAGFYGLDLYSLRASAQAVLTYLTTVDPGAARARARYACFDRFGDEMQQYGHAAAFGMDRSCEREVIAQLMELHKQRAEYVTRDGRVAPDDFFFAEQNARLVRNAEAYYRTMFRGQVESWNLRDRHMAETVGELLAFLDHRQTDTRIVIWAHNSHLGDARATQMGDLGEFNVGQLLRQKFGEKAALVGFTTHSGTVTAASQWDGPAHRRHVRPALPGSYERLFHDVGVPRFLLDLRGSELADALKGPMLERAIGVLYMPETERQSHYFRARLSTQFDHVLHFDETRAVEPLERTSLWESGELAETYPTGL